MMVKWKSGSNLNQTDTVLFTSQTAQAGTAAIFATLHEHARVPLTPEPPGVTARSAVHGVR